MRILYLADIRFPLERANGIQSFETCSALAERGHAVTLAVRPDTHRPARDPFDFYGRTPVAGLAIRTAGHRPDWLRRPGYLAFAARLATTLGGVDVVLTRDLGVSAALLRLPRRVRPPIVYESHGYAPAFSRALPDLVSGAPRPSALKLARLAAREHRVWRMADGYVTITRLLADELKGRFGMRPRLAVAPDGVRLDRARRFVRKDPGPAPVVAYAGHLYPWKGVDVAIEALARCPGMRGLIVGGHPGERDLMRLQHRTAALGIADRITFTGLLPPADVAGCLVAADILVLPNTATSISERYTSPLKLFEYLAAGRPIVASDLPAIREVVTHDVDAWLVPPGNPDALAAAITLVAGDRDLAARLAEAAWDRAAAFTWAARADILERLLREVVGSRRTRGRAAAAGTGTEPDAAGRPTPRAGSERSAGAAGS